MDTPTVVLIGPPGVGKSTVGPIVAARLGVAFVDLDAAGETYYAEVQQPISSLVERADDVGFVDAHRWWQPARVHAVRRAVADHARAVIALGAGHSHYEDAEHADALRHVVSECRVVLLLVDRNPSLTIAVLRDRCVVDKGHDWMSDGFDFLTEWVTSEQNRSLADFVSYSSGARPEDVANAIASAISAHPAQHRPRFVSADAAMAEFRGAPAIDGERLRADLDAVVSQDPEPRS